MSKLPKRDISPALQAVREFLFGRPHVTALRFEGHDSFAFRTQPPPNIPDGSAHKLFANYYVNRDARREVAPPKNLTSQTLIGEGSSASKMPIPGKVYHWD